MCFDTALPPIAAEEAPIRVVPIWITAKVLSGRALRLRNKIAALFPFDAMSRNKGTLVEANAISMHENTPLKRSSMITNIHSI